jgi:Chitobiase/beta-hexosaminidase C-terminal domain
VAFGLWTTGGAGSATASVGTLYPATNVSASPSSSTVAVSWTASNAAFGLTPQGYFVSRKNIGDSSTAAACGSDSAHLLTGTACSDTGVPSGNYQYSVTAVFATWTAASAASGAVTVVDVPPPYVQSITLADASPTTAPGSVHWTVTFSVAVTGVDATDFSLVNGGLGGTPAVTSAAGATNSYTVTAGSGSGSGTLGLNLVDNDSIHDAYNQPLGDNLGGPNGSFTGPTYTIDRAAPTNSLSLVAQSRDGSYLAGGTGTVFYRGTGSGSGGSFAVRNTVTDTGGSGAASSTTSALVGTATGWTHTPSTDSSPAGGPYDSNTFGWTEGTTSQPTETVTAADTAGNTTPVTLTFTNDSTAPTGGVLKVNGVLATAGGSTSGSQTGGFTIATRTDFAEAGSSSASGLASSTLTMQAATVGNGTCGSYGTAAVLIGKPTQSGLATGCYLFTLTGTDNVGNIAVLSTTVFVDPTPPATPTLAFTNLNNASYNASLGTLFFRKVAGGTYTVTAASSDAESGIASGNAGYTFTPVSGNGFTGTQSGGQVSYTFGTAATQPASARSVVANNAAGGSSGAASYTAVLDSTAPTGGALTVDGVAGGTVATTSSNTTGSFAVDARTDWSETASAAASGLLSSTLVRDQATLTNNVCGTFGSATTLTGTPTQDATAGISSGTCYRYTLTGSDQVGNSATVSTIVKVDTTAPVTTDNTAAIGGAWKNTTQTVTLSPNDANGSGVAATYYTTDGSTPTTSSTQGTSISLSTTGQYTIQYFSVDNAGNLEPVETAATVIRVDKTVPTNSLSLGSASGAFINGARLYYKSNAAGSFTLTNAVGDADSGAASATFPAIATTGWTHNAESVSTPAGGPFASSVYSWTASPSAPAAAARTFVGTDVAGNTSAGMVLTFTSDTTAPTGGALTVNGAVASAGGSSSTATGTSVTISTRTDYAESLTTSQSGLAASTLTIQSEALSNAVCGAPGSGGPYATAAVISGTGGPSLTLGFCYVYTLTGTDQVGNAAAVSTTVMAALPGVTNFTSANGGATVGKAEPGDTISVTFNTPLNPSSVPATGTITLCNNLAGCSTSTHTLITISGLSSTTGFNVPNVYEKSGFTQTINGTFSLSADHLTVTFTITGTPDANAKTDATTSSFTFTPSPALQDLAGDAAGGTYTTPAAITLF